MTNFYFLQGLDGVNSVHCKTEKPTRKGLVHNISEEDAELVKVYDVQNLMVFEGVLTIKRAALMEAAAPPSPVKAEFFKWLVNAAAVGVGIGIGHFLG